MGFDVLPKGGKRGEILGWMENAVQNGNFDFFCRVGVSEL
jgi:hypothetical protein